MPRRLIVMRHGKSDWDSDTPTDFDRPLAPRGERDVPRMARWLMAQHLTPQHIVSSPAVRARDTALLVARKMGFDEHGIEWARDIYEADVPELLRVLGLTPQQAAATLLVGHNPGLEDLVRFLADRRSLPVEDKLLPTAAVMIVDLPDDWRNLQRLGGKVLTHMRPSWLQDQ